MTIIQRVEMDVLQHVSYKILILVDLMPSSCYQSVKQNVEMEFKVLPIMKIVMMETMIMEMVVHQPANYNLDLIAN